MTVLAVAAAVAGGWAAGHAGVAVADRFAAPRPRRRLPLQELCTAAACVMVVVRFGPGVVLLPPIVAALSLVALSAVDLRTYRLPDAIIVPALGASVLAVAVESFATGRRAAVAVALLAGAGYSAVMWAAHALRPGALGFGDVKLAAILGVHLGWTAAAHHRPADAVALVAYALLAACVIGLGVALAAGLLRRRGVDALPDPDPDPDRPRRGDSRHRLRDTVIPFGPALSAGAAAAVMVSETLVG